jgi:hypothetical protein
MREMKRRDLLRQTAAFGLAATVPFRFAQGKDSDKAIPVVNPLKPPAAGANASDSRGRATASGENIVPT